MSKQASFLPGAVFMMTDFLNEGKEDEKGNKSLFRVILKSSLFHP